MHIAAAEVALLGDEAALDVMRVFIHREHGGHALVLILLPTFAERAGGEHTHTRLRAAREEQQIIQRLHLRLRGIVAIDEQIIHQPVAHPGIHIHVMTAGGHHEFRHVPGLRQVRVVRVDDHAELHVMLVQLRLQFAQERGDVTPAQPQPVLARGSAFERLGADVNFMLLPEVRDDGIAVTKLILKSQRVILDVSEERDAVVTRLQRLLHREIHERLPCGRIRQLDGAALMPHAMPVHRRPLGMRELELRFKRERVIAKPRRVRGRTPVPQRSHAPDFHAARVRSLHCECVGTHRAIQFYEPFPE